MTHSSPARQHGITQPLSRHLETALGAVSQMDGNSPPAANDLAMPPEPRESFSFLRYIPSPQEEYEHLYKVFTEAEAYWE